MPHFKMDYTKPVKARSTITEKRTIINKHMHPANPIAAILRTITTGIREKATIQQTPKTRNIACLLTK